MSSYRNGGSYRAVDGRVYEPDLSYALSFEHTPKGTFECDGYEFNIAPLGMSMKLIYDIELFLEGKPVNAKPHVPVKEIKRMKKEYPMLKRTGSNGSYRSDNTAVWEVLKAKYPLATAKYKNYTEALYAMQYGAEPIPWTTETPARREAGINA